jgi:hypothetical protein
MSQSHPATPPHVARLRKLVERGRQARRAVEAETVRASTRADFLERVEATGVVFCGCRREDFVADLVVPGRAFCSKCNYAVLDLESAPSCAATESLFHDYEDTLGGSTVTRRCLLCDVTTTWPRDAVPVTVVMPWQWRACA